MKYGFYKTAQESCKFADLKQIGESEWELQHDLIYFARDNSIYVISKGLRTDGASKGILKRFGKYTNAAILHDALYMSELEPRDVADDLFLEAMKIEGVSWWRRNLYWSAVRMFGWIVWKSHTKESVNKWRKFIRKVRG